MQEDFFRAIKYCNDHLTEDEIDQMIVQFYNSPLLGNEDESLKDSILEVAQKAFGIDYLYPWQRLVIANILDDLNDEKSNTNQIVLLPTGAGKSMCFLVPALVFSGATLILYPLLALMQDQERRMCEGSLASVTFRGGQTESERKELIQKIKDGKAKVILANPEVLQNQSLIDELKTCNISHIAIDEAHCVSEWGDTFRPAYLTLGKIIKELSVPKVTAFTATASPTVLDRVNEVLFDGCGHIVRSEADRPNIHYYVHYAHVKEKAVLDLALKEEKPMLIFCSTRKNAEKMAHLLLEQHRFLSANADAASENSSIADTDDTPAEHSTITTNADAAGENSNIADTDDTPAEHSTITTNADAAGENSANAATPRTQKSKSTDQVRFYHAGLSKEEKTETEKWFYPNKDAIMACTCAFGMGVDKKDIKTVIHLDVPQTAESFIQEAGRGGRDGSIAKSILVWSPDDTRTFRRFRNDSRQHVLYDFAQTRRCRRQVLLDALDAEQVACKGCDNCLGLSTFTESETPFVMQFIKKNNNCYTINEASSQLEKKERAKANGLSSKDFKMIFANLENQHKIILRPNLHLCRQKRPLRKK